MPETLSLPAPDYNGPKRQDAKAEVQRFGRGYSSVIAFAGAATRTWSLAWSQLTLAQVTAAESLVLRSLTTYFLFTLPDEATPRKFRVTEPVESVPTEYGYSLSMQLEEVP